MRRAHDLVGERALVEQLQDIIPALVAEFPGHGVHLVVFTEGPDSGSQQHKLSSVGHNHAGAVNAFVSDPGGFQFFGVQVGNDFFRPAFHVDDVQFLTELAGFFKRDPAVSDIESLEDGFFVLPGGDGLEEHHGNFPVNAVLLGVVVELAGGTPRACSMPQMAEHIWLLLIMLRPPRPTNRFLE